MRDDPIGESETRIVTAEIGETEEGLGRETETEIGQEKTGIVDRDRGQDRLIAGTGIAVTETIAIGDARDLQEEIARQGEIVIGIEIVVNARLTG